MDYSIIFNNTLFIHTGEKVKRNTHGTYYTDGSYNEKIWRRYKGVSKHLTVIFRLDESTYTDVDLKNKYNAIDGSIKVKPINDTLRNVNSFISIKKRIENRKILDECINKADFVIIRTPSTIANYVIKRCNSLNKKYMAEVVGSSWDSLWNHSLRGKLLAPYCYAQQRCAISRSRATLYVTEKYLQEKYPSIGLTESCSDAYIDVKQTKNKKISDKKNTTITLGTIGTVDAKYKGQQYVIAAIKKLQANGIDAVYQIVGGGNKMRLEKLARRMGVEANIKFIGQLKHAEIDDWLSGIDIYVQPSTTEGLCRSLLEAMSCGCSCIASDVGGNPELIPKEYLFKSKRPEEISKLIAKIKKENLFEDNSKKCKTKAEEYNANVLDKKRYNFYKRLSGAK